MLGEGTLVNDVLEDLARYSEAVQAHVEQLKTQGTGSNLDRSKLYVVSSLNSHHDEVGERL